ncbi:lipopolysaccharide kinase InaA family protein [Gelidibacter japonicus]|uniref:lipopolysaccharide kinase InaA family protein n=1 Tax=Gelidibacter japonicus TaxID=1962232 RepID=UPI003A938A1E
MKRKMKIHLDYLHLNGFIADTIDNFATQGHIIQNHRNEIKIFEHGKYKFVVKSFKKITIANRIIYKFLRKSKARRSYENALRLLDLKIGTPFPVAYVEESSGLFLKNSYFISCFVEHQTADKHLTESSDVPFLEAMGAFLFNLHKKEVFHYDLHTSNILTIKDSKGKIDFCLVDINRLKFKKPTKKRRVKNLNRLSLPFDQYSILISKYAEMAEFDVFSFAHKQLYQRKKYQIFRQIKSLFKDFYKKNVATAISRNTRKEAVD